MEILNNELVTVSELLAILFTEIKISDKRLNVLIYFGFIEGFFIRLPQNITYFHEMTIILLTMCLFFRLIRKALLSKVLML